MSARLIYHKQDSDSEFSPFDEAILQIVKDESINIACPYLGLDYLNRLTCLCKSWNLLTDVEEWIKSQNVNQRIKILDFIKNNISAIRHYPQLHAKTVMNSNAALLGSANFTEAGIQHRTELSILLNDEETINELNNWFVTQWNISSEIPLEKVQAFINGLPKETVENSSPKGFISPRIPNKDSKLLPIINVKVVATEVFDLTKQSLRLVEKIRLISDRHWFESYLNLAEYLITQIGIESSDPRLAMSIPKSKSNSPLPITINNRYVLAPYIKQDTAMIDIICGPEIAQISSIQNSIIDYEFHALSGENETDVPYLLQFQSAEEILDNTELRDCWIKAVKRELNRAKSSSFRKFHAPEAYMLVMNRDYRKLILEKAL